jgi:hypothetical protein
MDNGMDDLGLKEHLVDKGREISDNTFGLILESRKLKIGFKNAFSRSHLERLEKEYDKLYSEFMNHDRYVSSYMGMATRPFSMGIEDEAIDVFNIDTERIKILIYSYHLTNQRNNLRNLLLDAGNLLSSNRNQANNNAAIVVAAVSLLVALLSLAVSVIQIFA